MNKIKNPILPGFYPDPSICRCGDDFYMVCSSFELYPGIPVFHSKDLANWEQIGYALTMENGFHMEANSMTGGVMAPTIRYHKGTFYIMNTNFADRGNYIITAKDPAGPWSAPYWLDDVPGIDASIFFDEDDKVYIIGTGNVVKRADGSKDRGIWLAEFDLTTMKCCSEMSVIWDSALRNAASPESPHMYKVGAYYYLVIAEGGTEHYHAVTVARSKELRGWYEGNPANPVMTHRQFGFGSAIANVGHADLIETPQGDWYAVLLASRTIEGQHKNLGRETYICPVIWEREWPVFSPLSGKIDWEYPADPALPWTVYPTSADSDDFADGSLGMEWNFWGTPYESFYRLEDSSLWLKCLSRSLSTPIEPMRFGADKVVDASVSVVLRRQLHVNFSAYTEMTFLPQENETAGFIIMQATNHQYRIERACRGGKQVLRLVLVTTSFIVPPHMPGFSSNTEEEILVEVPWEHTSVVIGMTARGQRYDFRYGKTMTELQMLKEAADGKAINPECVGGMVGTMLGMFASGNGRRSDNEAIFAWFTYREEV